MESVTDDFSDLDRAIEDWMNQPDGPVDRLRSMRTKAGLSGRELAEAVGWDPSKVSRIENGKQIPTPGDLEAWSHASGADPDVLQGLLAMLGDVQATHPTWKQRVRRGQAARQAAAYSHPVAESKVARYFEAFTVPTLLQTPGYARVILAAMVRLHDLDIDDVDAAVTVQRERHEYLYDPGREFEFLIDEGVLYRRWGCSTAVMAAQLDRLLNIIGQSNIRLGVLPINPDPPVGDVLQGSFQIYDDLAVEETYAGDEAVYRELAYEKYVNLMDRLWASAVTDDAARQMVLTASATLRAAHLTDAAKRPADDRL